MKAISASLAEHFGALEDPRVEHLTDHKLLDNIAVAICAIICGAETWQDMAMFGQERLAWLRQFIALENGVPSDDTFGRLFARLEPEQFQACFTSAAALSPSMPWAVKRPSPSRLSLSKPTMCWL